jgi:uncharacterized membrane protein
MKQIQIILFLLLFILTGCSGSQLGTNDLKLEIITQQINSWVNLMPGSKPSFFISGSIKIKNNEGMFIDSVRLLKCEVLQEGKTIYELHPNLRSSVSIIEPMNPGNERIFTLYLPSGTPIKKELNLEKPVSIDLYLSAFNKVKQHKIDSIHVMKTY